THCHLDYLKSLPFEELLQKIQEAGIEKIVTIGVDPQNLDSVLKLSEEHSQIYFTQGIHPHDAKEIKNEDLEKIRTRASLPKMVAVGEIGLDYHYNNSLPDIQKKYFREQLQIAAENDLPVVIHTREADEDTKEILKEFSPLLKRKGVLHSFTSGRELAEYALSEDFYLGFNGIITFKN